MSAAAPATQPETQPSRSSRLLALIRKLIDYGRELGATVRQRLASDPGFARNSFGTADIAVIFARIARGLLLARALEARVLRRAAWLDKGPGPRKARAAPKPKPLSPGRTSAAPGEPAFPPAEATGPHQPQLDPLPRVEQIAAEVRRRPIGAVIAEIYYSLGLMPAHPLWLEVKEAMYEFGGSLAWLLRDIFDRALPLHPPPPAPSGTGPP